ncbi:MAG: glycoside hydrolase family 2 TIM barrel-domain containing protein [Eubacteriales bacterium]|nr:glycoside hydrolase family 2 TIM barrel-domain containing protein [Eubacteriales bacterium]MDD3882753.1 glycoside hydrolase family 2 TIM barrel-domain containing protein [Eubacteriales bacterium]MDD4512626.1 glycoside hydrolase family 2 TIM barrel-domain containing protein [Eubacteriales bacterium]
MENRTELFCSGWEFAKLGVDSDIAAAQGSDFAPVDVPHDFLIYNTNNLYETCTGWYRRAVKPFEKPCRTVITFDGVYMDSAVYVNGEQIAEWKYGYTRFSVDLTDFLHDGENELMVSVRHQSPNSRWYSGAGIYRDVFISRLPETHFTDNGIYVSAKKAGEAFEVYVSAEVNNPDCRAMEITAYDADGNTVAASSGALEQTFTIDNPILWSVDKPYLYSLSCRLVKNGEIVDELCSRFGLRDIAFDSEKGFFLNGEHMKLSGVCMHNDLGALGSAVNRAALARQIMILKSMGVNALRTSHNPPATALLDVCDELGMLVMDEFLDMWEKKKTDFDYARFFPKWHERDAESWIKQGRNHPSVILWSIGNEIYDTHSDKERGMALTSELKGLAERYDYRKNAFATFGSNYIPWENTQACADILKIVGYNYAERFYAKHHEEHPDWCIYGSETSSVVQSRGIYHFPLKNSILADDDLQCSSLGNSPTSWGAVSIEDCLCDDRDAAFSLGTFLWTGFDYIGEPTPYHTKNSYFGMIDTAGFEKDAYWVCRSLWTDAKKDAFVHLYPYWDWSEGEIIDVRVVSNLPTVRLSLDGKVIGTQKLDHLTGRNVIADFSIPYEKGELTAEGLDENGIVRASDSARSFGDAASIILEPSKLEMTADGRDMIFVTIRMADALGAPVENATNRVNVSVTGAGRLVGLDNGDSTDTDSYKGTSRRLFSGKLLAMIMSRGCAGDVTLTVTSQGLPEAQLTLSAQNPSMDDGVSADEENKPSAYSDEVPVRKIELVKSSSSSLTPDNNGVTVKAIISPANATYTDVSFRAATAMGIDTNLAKIAANGNEVRVEAVGDGEFYLRASVNCGYSHPEIISLMHFTAEGFGEAVINPYSFVSAGLYNVSSQPLPNGNDRGVSIPPASADEVMFGFERVDFGSYGSDEIGLWVFTITFEPSHIEVWDGNPYEGGELLTIGEYPKTVQWNTYDEKRWKLPKRLRGMHTICFKTKDRVHIKGFSFTKTERAFAKVPAVEADSIYGDKYTVSDGSVNEIGNNVTLSFVDINFGEGASRIAICGNSPIDKNTIHIRFTDKTGKTEARIIEFTRTNGVETREFDIDLLVGSGEVSFVFLPGSNFDFESFMFQR